MLVDSLSAIKYAKVTPIKNEDGLIVDFKTDRINDMQELKARYSGQLTLYRRALEKIFPAVGECILYSTKLKQTVVV